ncbi:MAG: hypothetical protein AB8G14_02750 [Ilumatobacter sp.]
MSLDRIRRRRDAGTTLPELLIVVTMMGVIAAVVAVSISVTFRVTRSSEGRVNLSRAEQNIDVWLPADLASTNVKDTDLPAVDLSPTATPCGNCGGLDLSGANALQLSWSTQVAGPPLTEVVTKVQYQYILNDDEWQVQRIECVGTEACRMAVVLRDLPAPADVANYDTIRPVEIFDVSEPDTNPNLSDNAQRVVVTINGGGNTAGAGGGTNTVALTAGGRVTSEIDADDFTVPSFVRAGSRCGGPISLLVDTSGSIPGSVLEDVVEPGVQAFINAFRDTPTQIQIIEFGDHARPMGPGNDWHKYVDMTDSAAVDALIAEAELLTNRRAGARTNWEDPFFRAFRNADGTVADQAANRVVFFTDGISTVHRRMDAENPSKPVDQFWTGTQTDFNAGKYNSTIWTAIINQTAISRFNQEAFDRTDALLDRHRSTDLIFVGVGPDLTANNTRGTWIQNPQAYVDPNAPLGTSELRFGADILTTLLGNGGLVVPAEEAVGGGYTNPDVANYYQQNSFNAAAFAEAMRAAALKDCGGTLTLQTRLADGSPVADEFIYENTAFRDDAGTVIDSPTRRVTTSDSFKTGTFDFDISDGTEYYDVDVVPQELQTLAAYEPVGWSCRSGADSRTTTAIPIPTVEDDGSAGTADFEGITVRVRPNEAVSCILTVTAS